jgi:hypothetical protein
MLTSVQQKALLKGMEWQKSQLALRRLKTMLWAMEALRIFDDKLLSALTEINEARSHLMQELNKVGNFAWNLKSVLQKNRKIHCDTRH